MEEDREQNKRFPLLLFFVAIAVVVGVSIMLSANRTSAATTPLYKGAEYCGGCHSDIYQGWNQTNHAHAVLFMHNDTGNFYGIGATNNLAGTPSYRTESGFRSSCRNCHTTGGNNWDPINQGVATANMTWPEWNTTPTKFLNIQCEVCHGAYQSHGSTNPAMILNYSAALCEQCHSGSHGNSFSQSAHAQSLTDLLSSTHAGDYCLQCMSTQGSLGLTVHLNTTNLTSISCVTCHDPHSHTYDGQLRYENSTAQCGQCHSQATVFQNSAHYNAGLECISCHGQGTHLSHGSPVAVLNHTWGIYNTFYPYNQTEPLVCSSAPGCHNQTWATSQLGVIQGLTGELIANATSSIDNAKAAITLANQTSGVDAAKIASAQSMVTEAESKLDDVSTDASGGLHNPEGVFAILSDAARLATEAQSIAQTAKTDALSTQSTDLGTQVSTLQNQVSTLQNQTVTLQGDIDTMQAKIDELQSTGATSPYLYGGLGLAIGFVIGAAVLFVLRRGKK